MNDAQNLAAYPGAKPLNLRFNGDYVARQVYQDPKYGTEVFVAFDADTNSVILGCAGINGLPQDRPDMYL